MEGSDKEKLSEASYQKLLNPTGTGIMGSLDIPKIGIELPVYHGTNEEALSKGVGHLCGKQSSGRRKKYTQHTDRTPGTAPVQITNEVGRNGGRRLLFPSCSK